MFDFATAGLVGPLTLTCDSVIFHSLNWTVHAIGVLVGVGGVRSLVEVDDHTQACQSPVLSASLLTM